MAKPKRGTIQVAAAPGALQLRDFGGAAAVVVRCREENAHQNHMEERKLPFMLLSWGLQHMRTYYKFSYANEPNNIFVLKRSK